MGITNLAFYTFVPIKSPEGLRRSVLEQCENLGLLGTFLIAEEGINGMLAGVDEATQSFAAWLRSDPRFADLHIKESKSASVPFQKLQVKVKPEIVTMRTGYVDVTQTAPALSPEEWKQVLNSDEDIFLIDTRNSFEYEVGTFKGARDPKTVAFHEFPAYVEQHREEMEGRKILMFCTGGIRCEKATAWMRQQGFENVYQLEGGVLNYFERIPDADEDWQGKLFVFDERIVVNTRLEPTNASRHGLTVTVEE